MIRFTILLLISLQFGCEKTMQVKEDKNCYNVYVNRVYQCVRNMNCRRHLCKIGTTSGYTTFMCDPEIGMHISTWCE